MKKNIKYFLIGLVLLLFLSMPVFAGYSYYSASIYISPIPLLIGVVNFGGELFFNQHSAFSAECYFLSISDSYYYESESIFIFYAGYNYFFGDQKGFFLDGRIGFGNHTYGEIHETYQTASFQGGYRFRWDAFFLELSLVTTFSLSEAVDPAYGFGFILGFMI